MFNLYMTQESLKVEVDLSAEASEYADCTFAEG